MFVALKLTLDQAPDAVWGALRDPEVFQRVSGPLLRMSSREASGFPAQWSDDGAHLIEITLLGRIRVGQQTIDIRFDERADGTRILTDAGKPQNGALTVIREWRHRMAVSPLPGGRTEYRDRLDFGAGLLSPAVWIGLWAFWQWRAFNLRRTLRRR